MDIMKVKDEQGNWITVPAFQGPVGNTPNFSIGTVEKGTEAGATITGTRENPVLNLTLPKGDKGDTGEVSQVEFNALADLVDGKSDIGHDHDERYYTETEADALLAGKSGTGHTHDERYYTESEIDTKFTDFLKTVYPVGAIYLSVNNTSPATLFGGTWERIKDTFLLAAGDTYAGGTIGGEAEHTLIVSEMPSHTHNYGQYKGVAGWSGTSPQRNFLKTTGNDGWSDTNNDGYMTTIAAGGGAAHNNMPPYLAVYVWKRTA